MSVLNWKKAWPSSAEAHCSLGKPTESSNQR
jgi:hypothetical protein